MTEPAGGFAPALIRRDQGLLWHPYAPLDGPPPYAVVAASGTRLVLESADGARFDAVDAMSSWWCAVHGYRHPELDAAAHGQIERFSHVMFGGLTHEPAVRLAEHLVDLTPEPLRHVFLADSGSVSIEVALKLAVQYHAARGHPGRRAFVALRGAYHGDTTGAMSVCDPIDGMHSVFPGLVAGQRFLPRPPAARTVCGRLVEPGPDDLHTIAAWAAQADSSVAARADTLAAIIIEPVLQGAGGMYVYWPQCVTELRRIADRHGLLLIVDEIATGFGRLGAGFAVEWAAVTPDVLCVGKALTGGYLSLAAVVCTPDVAETITRSPQRALLHGPTFMANPLACAVASASLSLLTPQRIDRVHEIGHELAAALAPAVALESVHDVRVLGAVGAVELDRPVDVPAVTRAALRHGAWVRPFRNLVYTMPPYVAGTDDIATIAEAIICAIAEVHR